jgi:ketosteroid isomerase-like protein
MFNDNAKFLAPGISEMSGKKALTDFFAREFPNIENYSIDILETWEKGDSTVIEWKNRYVDKRTGKSHQVAGVTIITVKNALIEEMREYCNIAPL